jgi:DNA-3-methyladenine glycosylase I
MPTTKQRPRCAWPGDDRLMVAYHDEEWGVPLHDDRRLFEFLVLDAFQAGLSWRIVLHKRQAFERAFHRFDPKKVARYGDTDYGRLVNDAGIVRNRAKIIATIGNAQRFLDVQREFGSFDRYVWGFVDGRPVVNRHASIADIPARTALSDSVSKDLTKRGFRFVGSTITYAFLQAAGLVNDHVTRCFRYNELRGLR